MDLLSFTKLPLVGASFLAMTPSCQKFRDRRYIMIAQRQYYDKIDGDNNNSLHISIMALSIADFLKNQGKINQ
ncbi:hypothetical protein FACS1894216_06400 [Synergistales bacterium]|nr:hypothetical protein FACS1894216_06400 [Synergistales bacterium]